jgi:sugar lactone lactonase YvrE
LARYSPEGELDRVENFPVSQVTCPAFGGEYFDTIFVTSACQGLKEADLKVEPLAGKVFHFESDVVGLAEYQVEL